MQYNPFTSNTFATIWLKHFNNLKPSLSFNFIKQLTFIKNKFLPLYINVGKNNTNGISYKLDDSKLHSDYKNKVFLIYDVPTYFKLNTPKLSSNLKLKTVNQYNGALTNIDEFYTFDDFLLSKFKSKNRYNLKKKKKQLESNFNISYSVYDNTISEEMYVFLSEHLNRLIAKRFNSKKTNNRVLNEWNYYKELMLPMLKEKKAVILTVNNDNIPIGMTYNFLSDDTLFYSITTFDIEYTNFNIGHTTIMEILKWCFDNKIKIIDFSKGEAEYKSRWLTDIYFFQNHILYDSNSLISSIIAEFIYHYFKLKQYLRDMNVNSLYTKLKYIFKKN